ncbi:DUF2865 domain-containing protein [Cohaesibacter gelatinilyticus]|uniref:DUF2865 domain-containing protein n=1 Tax=Cohaesibacter gelatinilyticus TaxID=372072 RepID=A0A285NGN0_9HYPH|nr:DUF2865 domain-containing protein [Cohaesibacter gelatinilyticus]SNZ08137.1 Protein of unknown function [Cohaesibacter gelatinilyticus]HAT84498.1 DUF2865 domain-containing protein [Hyphomicrobiales bacterium]
MGRHRHSALVLVLCSLLAVPVLGTISAHAQSKTQKKARYCAQLEGQLARLQRSGNSRGARNFAKYDAAVHKQQAQIDVAMRTAKRDGCLGGGFLFRRQPKATCPSLMKRIDKMKRNMAKLQKKRSRFNAPTDVGAQKAAVARKLANARCGDQYAAFEDHRPTRQRRGLFGALFGQPTLREPDNRNFDMPQVGTYRTVCVRTCDGYFFPVSFSTTRGNFARDADICQANCPGTNSRLYVYSNPGESPEDMRTPQGEPYRSLDTAFKYRTEFVKGCSCQRPQSELTSLTKSDLPQSQRLPTLKSSQPLTPARSGPLVPIPMPKPDLSIDPDTQQAQLQGIPFNPYKPPEVSSDKKLVQAADGRSIRIVGPKFFGSQE